ncbi:MAG: flagellar assembly peptidoglycan hydrolase FlgJ [Lautropia sp.]
MSLSPALTPPVAGPGSPGLALDARALDALRRDADRDPEAAARQAAQQFEALFMQQLMKSMRAAVPKSGMFDGPGAETYTSMLDSQLAQTMAGKSGGLADIIARQITRHMNRGNGAADAVPPNPADPASGTDPGYGRITIGRGGAAGPGAAATEAIGAEAARVPGAADAAVEARPLNPVQAAFVERMWPHARAAERKTGVPAAYVIGQAALESGWGRRDIRDADGNPSYNLFGIKATGGWQGRTIATLTTEYVDGEARKSVEQFRRYESYEQAFTDWADLMNRSARYAGVLRADSASEFAQALGRSGYATDPRYGDKLERTINQTLQHARRDR